MKSLLRLGLILIALTSTRLALADQDVSAEFKGYVAINRVLQERLVQPNQDFALGKYLDEEYSDFGTNLLDLLGTFKGGSLDSSFHNGHPNVINMVLWHVAFSGLSRELSGLCVVRPALLPPFNKANPDFLAALLPVCAWPQASAKADDVLLGFWLSLMSFDAPMAEFEAWRDFFKGPAFADASAAETVSAMILAAFTNPHFLLRK